MAKEKIKQIIRGLLSNLEVTVDNISVRVLLQEQTQDFEEVPTVLLRLKQIEFKKMDNK